MASAHWTAFKTMPASQPPIMKNHVPPLRGGRRGVDGTSVLIESPLQQRKQKFVPLLGG